MTTTAIEPVENIITTAPILQARNLTKTYATGNIEVRALRGVDIDIGSGEMVMIMGPSGHGKTTLLNCLSGLDDINSGTVMIGEHNVHEASDRARTRFRAKHMGFIFQGFNLISVLSAAENVEIPLLINGVGSRKASKLAEAMLDRVGLGQRLQNHPTELSGGEQQRVAIARALVTEPQIIWADEPTGNLDSKSAESILSLLREVHYQGQSLVIVTHDPTIAEAGTRRVQIEDGLISSDMVVPK